MINMNYSLNNVDAKSFYNYRGMTKIGKSYKPSVYSEGNMMTELAEFSNTINNVYLSLNEIADEVSTAPAVGSSGELYIYTVNGMVEGIDKVIKNIEIIKKKLLDFYTQVESSVKATSDINKPSSVKENNKITTLPKALMQTNTEDKSVRITDIDPTDDLLDPNFPNTDIIGNELVNAITSAEDYTTKLSGDNDVASESLSSFINSQEDNIFAKMFGKYTYDKNDVIGSSILTANKAFGDGEFSNKILTSDMYTLACYNIRSIPEVITAIEAIKTGITLNYRKLVNTLYRLRENISHMKLDSKFTGNIESPTKEFANKTNNTIQDINRILNVVNKTITANYELLFCKGNRIVQIYGATGAIGTNSGDSITVRDKCEDIINKYYGDYSSDTDENNLDFSNETKEELEMQSECDTIFSIMDMMFNEETYNNSIDQYILNEAGEGTSAATPATGNTNAAPATPQPAAPAEENKSTTTSDQNTGNNVNNNKMNKVTAFIAKIVQQVTELANKFVNSIQKIIADAVNSGWWKNNKDKLSKPAAPGETTVSDWYDFNIDNFKVEPVLFNNNTDFDPNKPEYQSDEAITKAFLDKYSNHVAVDNNDKFSDKMKKMFYTDYYKDTVKVATTKLFTDNAAWGKVYRFIDEFLSNGNNSQYLGNLEKNRKDLDELQKYVSGNMQAISAKYKDNNANNATPAKTETPAAQGNVEGNTTEVKAGGESATLSDDFNSYRFNLAEEFCLYTRRLPLVELKIDSDPATKESSQAVNAITTRFFKYHSYAITAKMTSMMSCFKRYMTYFKSVVGTGRQNNTKPANNGANNQGNNNGNKDDAEKHKADKVDKDVKNAIENTDTSDVENYYKDKNHEDGLNKLADAIESGDKDEIDSATKDEAKESGLSLKKILTWLNKGIKK